MQQLTILLSVALLISCKDRESIKAPKNIIIAGKVVGYDRDSGDNILTIYVNDTGRATQLSYPTAIDSLGHFHVTFQRYYPQDVMISYLTNFMVIVHPGDSLHVQFNGQTSRRTEIFETVKYGGDASALNAQLSKYLKTYFETRPATDLIRKNEKRLNPDNYKKFQDSIRIARETQRDQFIKENEPDPELKTWINSNIQLAYCEQLFDYPYAHRMYNGLPEDWEVEEGYYAFIDALKPIAVGDLIYSDTRYFTNRFLNSYVRKIAWSNADSVSKKNADSLIFHQIIELSPKEGLVKQMALDEFVNTGLSKYEVAFYEKNKTLIDSLITENYLIDPMHDHYHEVKNALDKPVFASEIEVNGVKEKFASVLWQKILGENKGKLIYIDCWATWCAPCISEFPNSKRMMEAYKGKDVAFVYLCLRSKEMQWKAVVADQQLKGRHFFLDDEQSAYFEKLLKVSGYPTYAIIDKEGRIVRTGSSFRPLRESTEKIIRELL